ncbi:hypothetical protein VPNG_03412 [Cytospora leucostoma]|uniref:Uncharacterized protein n=1 Tax=Cytospora leucostoma TaxID=1230097 RepID=A0A423XFV5_9PEZI|nr:hypothetical protein VPNG_03412 [Cytospora leucostoma]
MSNESVIAKFGLSCPYGGSFFICEGAQTQFLGCCTEDPCAGDVGHCHQTSLRYSSFSKDRYLNIKRENCAYPYDWNTWWTCQGAQPPFMGCCASNPCNCLLAINNIKPSDGHRNFIGYDLEPTYIGLKREQYRLCINIGSYVFVDSGNSWYSYWKCSHSPHFRSIAFLLQQKEGKKAQGRSSNFGTGKCVQASNTEPIPRPCEYRGYWTGLKLIPATFICRSIQHVGIWL